MYGMDKRRLELVPHDENWKDDFLAEKRRITAALDDTDARVEHVGSTSIPKIHAKPILDIAVLCGGKNPAAVAAALESLGYDYRGRFDDQEDGHFYAVRDEGHVRLCQAHIYSEANADWHAKLKFRDSLRENAALAREYEEYKLRLARTTSDKSAYAAIKTKWLDEFILKVL